MVRHELTCVDLEGHTDVVLAIAYAPDAARFFSAAADGTVLSWPTSGGAPRALAGLRGTPDSLEVDGTGQRVLAKTRQGEVFLWTARDLGAPIVCSAFHEDPEAAILHATFSPDGRTVAALASNHGVYLFRADVPSDYRVLWAHGDDPVGLCFGREGDGASLLVAGFRRGGAISWDLAALPPRRRPDEPPDVAQAHFVESRLHGVGTRRAPPFYDDVALSPDGAHLALVSGEDVLLHETRLGTVGSEPRLAPRATLHGGKAVRRARFFRQGNQILTAAGDGSARIHRVDLLDWPPIVLAHPRPLYDTDVGQSGAVVATQDDRCGITLWRTDDTLPPLELSDDERSASAFALDPTGRTAAVGYEGGLIQLFRLDLAWQSRWRPRGTPLEPNPIAAHMPGVTVARVLLERAVQWMRTGDAAVPLVAMVDGQTFALRATGAGTSLSLTNAAGEVLASVSEWPAGWKRPTS